MSQTEEPHDPSSQRESAEKSNPRISQVFDLFPDAGVREDRVRVYLRNHVDAERHWVAVETPPIDPVPDSNIADESEADEFVAREPAVLASDPDVQAVLSCPTCRPLMIQLQDRYERIYRAVEQTGDSVVITDRHGVIEYVNPAFEQTTGYSGAEVIGKTPRLLKSGAHDETFYESLWGGLLSGNAFRGTIVNRKKQGELYPAEQTITPIRDAGGTITHFVSVLKDITLLLRNKEQEFNMAIAREIQQRFYTSSGSLEGFDFHGTAIPVAATGGDYFDFLPTPRGNLMVVLADVCGHGFGAALVMSETRAYCRAFAAMDFVCTEVLDRVNERLYSDLDNRSFVTMSMLCIDPRSRAIVFAGAGHEPGVLMSREGKSRLLCSAGFPLGMFPDSKTTCATPMFVNSGDIAVLMTDGITEALSPEGEEFGLGRALEVIERTKDGTSKEIGEAIVVAARDYMNGHAQTDDIALVVCKAL